jgi:hypothetical protein
MVIYYFMKISNKDNIKINRRVYRVTMLANYTDQLRSAVNMTISLPYKAGEFLHYLSNCKQLKKDSVSLAGNCAVLCCQS